MPFKRSTVLEAGDYEAVHTGIEEKESRDGSEFKIWNFEVQTPNGLVDLSGTSSLNSGPSSKPFQWAKAILGRAPTPEEFDDDLAVLEGKPCRLVVVFSEKGYNTIETILPVRLSESTIREYADQADLELDDPFEIGEAS